MLWTRAGRAPEGWSTLPRPYWLGYIPTHPQQKIFASVIFPQLKWLGRPNRSHVEGKKIEKGEYEKDNNDERVKRIQRGDGDDDES